MADWSSNGDWAANGDWDLGVSPAAISVAVTLPQATVLSNNVTAYPDALLVAVSLPQTTATGGFGIAVSPAPIAVAASPPQTAASGSSGASPSPDSSVIVAFIPQATITIGRDITHRADLRVAEPAGRTRKYHYTHAIVIQGEPDPWEGTPQITSASFSNFLGLFSKAATGSGKLLAFATYRNDLQPTSGPTAGFTEDLSYITSTGFDHGQWVASKDYSGDATYGFPVWQWGSSNYRVGISDSVKDGTVTLVDTYTTVTTSTSQSFSYSSLTGVQPGDLVIVSVAGYYDVEVDEAPTGFQQRANGARLDIYWKIYEAGDADTQSFTRSTSANGGWSLGVTVYRGDFVVSSAIAQHQTDAIITGEYPFHEVTAYIQGTRTTYHTTDAIVARLKQQSVDAVIIGNTDLGLVLIQIDIDLDNPTTDTDGTPNLPESGVPSVVRTTTGGNKQRTDRLDRTIRKR